MSEIRFTLTFVSLLLTITCTSQSGIFPRSNADWYLELSDQMYIEGYSHYSIEKDTVISGDTCQIISLNQEYYFTGLPEPQLKQVSYDKVAIICVKDSVLLKYHEPQSIFDTIVDYKAGIGDTWRVFDREKNCIQDAEPYFTATVQDTGVSNINGKILRWVKADYTHSYYTEGNLPYTDTIFELFLGKNGFFFENLCLDQAKETFRCFQYEMGTANEFSYTTASKQCNYISDVGLDENQLKEESIFIYPQPSINNEFHIEGLQKNDQIFLVDLSGVELSVSPISINNFDVSNINKGLYFIKIIRNRKIITSKIIIQ
jgi:hypothetical protein